MHDVVARQRVADARVGRLATVTPEGKPHVVPCCFVLVGDVVYTAVDGKPKSTLSLQRLRNMAVQSAASLLIDHYVEEWSELWWVRMDGTTRVLDVDAESELAKGALRAKYPQYQNVAIPGPAIALDIASWVSWP